MKAGELCALVLEETVRNDAHRRSGPSPDVSHCTNAQDLRLQGLTQDKLCKTKQYGDKVQPDGEQGPKSLPWPQTAALPWKCSEPTSREYVQGVTSHRGGEVWLRVSNGTKV